MNKLEMIEYIDLWYESWDSFCIVLKSISGDKIDNWFVSYDGQEHGDVFLCSENPRGDSYGEIITKGDCFR